MKNKCPNCRLVNFEADQNCRRCRHPLLESAAGEGKRSFFRSKLVLRAGGLLAAVFIALFGFYLTLIVSAKRLDYNQKRMIENAVLILEDRGFGSETFLLRFVTAYRAEDNWLNASIEKENAYAATNFPFEIMTIYPDFFQYPQDETERAAILLHEAQHLKGGDEKQAYEYVWKNRQKLGWTKEKYAGSVIWHNVRNQTREVAPELFTCPAKEFNDCTE